MYLVNFYEGSLKIYDRIYTNRETAIKEARSWATENGSTTVVGSDEDFHTIDFKGDWMTRCEVKNIEVEEEDYYDGALPGDYAREVLK